MRKISSTVQRIIAVDVNLLRFSPLKVYETFCDFNFCGFQKPVNSKIQKKQRKRNGSGSDQILQNYYHYHSEQHYTLSRGAKQMISDIKISEISFPFGFESWCGI